jgi:hypothetical protein
MNMNKDTIQVGKTLKLYTKLMRATNTTTATGTNIMLTAGRVRAIPMCRFSVQTERHGRPGEVARFNSTITNKQEEIHVRRKKD